MKKLTLILFAVALLAVGFYVANSLEAEQSVTEEVVVQNAEPTIGRIDLLTRPFTEEAQFIIYGDDNAPLKEAAWLQKVDARGYSLQKDGDSNTFFVEAVADTDINIALRGKWERDAEQKMVPHWVEFTSLKINDEEILPDGAVVWHNKPFHYTIKAKAGETYTVSAKWQKPAEIPAE